jgi:hypothetical protein
VRLGFLLESNSFDRVLESRVKDLSRVLDCSLVSETHPSILLLLFLLVRFHILLFELLQLVVEYN